MPSNERLRLDHGEELTPINQPGQRDERQARRDVGPPRLDLPFEVQRQLLAEEQVLGGKPPTWPQDRQGALQDVASDAYDRADVKARTGLRHATGCYGRRRPR